MPFLSDRGSRLLENIGSHMQDYMVPQSKDRNLLAAIKT
jgi:hypothetical protein